MPGWGYFQESLFHEYKNKLDKSEKSREYVKRFYSQKLHFVCLALFKIVLLQYLAQDILKSLSLSLLPSSEA